MAAPLRPTTTQPTRVTGEAQQGKRCPSGHWLRAFVTGVTGQDGSYLAERLLADDVEVHGLVHAATSEDPVAEGVVAHEGDLADADAVRRPLDAMARAGIDDS